MEARREQLDWIPDYLDDIESDLSVFHRIDDWRTLDGPRFFRYVVRLSAYAGVLQARAVAEEEKRNPTAPASSGGGRSAQRATEVADSVKLQSMPDWIEYRGAEPPV